MSDEEYSNYQQNILKYVHEFNATPFDQNFVKNEILKVLKSKKIIAP